VIDWSANVLAPNRNVFGEAVVYTPTGKTPINVQGIFYSAFRDVTLSEFGTEVTSVRPVLEVVLSDFPANPAQGDTLVVTRIGKTFTVREPRLNSHGGALLILNYLSG
jgi:hypothetical protein